jgi:DNA invertase Pin-like site-specific DNA recombinase
MLGLVHIFGALAEFERNLIRERTNAGLTAARERGRIGGRPKALTQRQIRIAQSL